jgi:hypothetical protein
MERAGGFSGGNFWLGKKFFFEKKAGPPANQKTFLTLGHGLWRRQRPWSRVEKFFFFAGGQPFFKKRNASLL